MTFPQFGEIIEEETPDFEIFGEEVEEYPSMKEPSSLKETGRHVARSASRAAESLGGLPGDVLGIGEKILQSGAQRLGVPEKVSKAIRPTNLPTSQEIRNISEKIFGETVKPQSGKEELVDDIISDAAVMAVPFKGKIPFIRSIGSAVAGNLGSEVAKGLGFKETGQTVAKLGGFFLGGLSGRGTVKKYWNQQYKLANESIPKGAKTSTKSLNKDLRRFEREVLRKGGPTGAKRQVKEFYNDLYKKSQKGDMAVDELTQYKHDINQNRSSLYNKELSKTEQKVAKRYYDDLANSIEDQIGVYGKENPQFLKHWKNAQEAFGGYYQSKRVGNWVKKMIPFTKAGKASLLIAEAIFRPTALKFTVPGYGIFKGAELATRMLKNPTLRRYYGNLMKDSLKENKAGFLKNLSAMDKELKKSDPWIYEQLTSEQNSN